VDFVYFDANDAACAYNERSREELIGARLLDVLPGHAASGHLELYAHTVDTGEALVLDDSLYLHDIRGQERRYDMRAVRIGEAVSVTWRDVTERYEAAQRIADSEEHFRLLADNSSDVVVRLRDDIIDWASPALTATLGWAPSEWAGRSVEEFIHPDDRGVIDRVRGPVEAGDTWVTTMRLRAKDGSPHWVEVHAGAFLTPDGEHDGTVASFRIVDAEIEAQQALTRRATYDDLTGALKRDPALEQLQQIGHHPRRPGAETGVLFMDIDDFKSINDTHGHAAGDTLLKAITQRIQDTIRADDSVARMGGDEFLVTLKALHDLNEAIDVAEKLRSACALPTPTEQGPMTVTVSIGVTLADPIETGDQIVARADQAMYRAKRAGRNTVAAIPIDPA
jgi:diguanylate cyclase (GGDEF)-like protein/PAS domain S-box-containing protein